MKRSNPDRVEFTINIMDHIYKQVMKYVSGSGIDQTAAIQEIVGAGALRLKSDMIEKKNSSISAQIEYLMDEINHFSSEIRRLEKLRNEYETDSEYINNRLDKLNTENKELEVLIKQQGSESPQRKLDDNKL